MNYPNYYSPYVNNFVSQPQMPQSNGNVVGKVVDSLEMVRGADIPMDGQAYYFPKADGSMVYSKKWLPNCTTQIMAYTPIADSQTNNLPNNNVEGGFGANMNDTDISQKINLIEEKIDNIEKLLSGNKPTQRKVVKDES